MVCETRFLGDSVVHRVDPRVRILIAFAFSVLIAVSTRLSSLGGGLAFAIALAVTARIPVAPALKRLAPVNVFMLLLILILPLTTLGEPLLHVGPFRWTKEGAIRAATIALKCNAIVLCLTVMLSTMELVKLGHALHHLRVPGKLTHLFLFTVRYLEVLHHEYQRLLKAMKVRCFHPRMNLHTYRTFAHLVGMLLVKSLDRSERIASAMKCRGFRGSFYVLDHFALGRRDVVFGIASILVLLALTWSELS